MDLVWETTSYQARSPSSSLSSIAEATAGNDVSSFLNSREEGPSVDVHSKHWNRVLHLEPTTTDEQLKKMFYPYGADEAFTVTEGGALVGYVGFGMAEMAKLGAEKMHDFIPCRQTQALQVCAASLEDVLVARTRVCVKVSSTPVPPVRSLVSVLYSSVNERDVAAFIQHSGDVPGIVAEVAREISHASRTILERIMLSLAELHHGWPQLQEFREGLLRQLLRLLLESTDRCLGQGINCGTAIGNLFAMRIVDGDPFQIAARLLQRGADSVVHVDSICLIARVCGEMPRPVSRASFWALVGSIAGQTVNADIQTALLNNLRSLTLTSPHPLPPACFFTSVSPQHSFSCAHDAGTRTTPLLTTPHTARPCPTSVPLSGFAASTVSAAPREPQMAAVKARTVYVSHLSPLVMQGTLMNYLLLAGPVNRVRICAGSGHATLFAFVEMQSESAARATMRLNGVELMGTTLRVQTARNAIQDVVPEDATFGPRGELLKTCQFGESRLALKDCVVRMPASH